MGSKIVDGVWFAVYSHDHEPPHVHGRYGNVEVKVDLLPGNKVRQSARRDAVAPGNAKRSDIRHILETASDYAGELKELWERTHGGTS